MAFRDKGHNAFSCDIQECSGGHPEWHIHDDCIPLLNGFCNFKTADGMTHFIRGKWDLIIAHPPCTDLAVSGARWFPEKQRDFRQQKSCVFFMYFVLANCDRIAIENPIGIMSTCFRKPDQIIQPYEYGHHTKKSTCLWLKGLPKLVPTSIVDPTIISYKGKDGRILKFGNGIGEVFDKSGKTISWNNPRTAKARSRTFPGIAKAMANQWGIFNE